MSRWRWHLLVAIFPLWWMLVTSLKRPVDIFSGVSLAAAADRRELLRLFDDYHFG